jgi:aminoglycoside 6'-N-acetyltransferase
VRIMQGKRLTLRPAGEADLDAIVEMIAEPKVRRWWGRTDRAQARRDLLDDPDTETLAVELQGELIGIVLVSEANDPDYRHASLDISLKSAHHGQGLGREALAVAIEHLIRERGHHRITIDPAAENEVAIRSYSRLGFKPVGIMRQYERAPDGQWRDGLLMDLLADEWDPHPWIGTGSSSSAGSKASIRP